MHSLILFVHVAACILLVISVLLQSGKGSALAVFGGGGGDNLFSASSGTTFIKKFTLAMAVIVAITSLTLTYFATRLGTRSVTDRYAIPGAAAQAPARAGQSAPDASAANTPAQPAPAAPAGK